MAGARLSFWLAATGIRSRPIDHILRIIVGAVATVIVLFLCAMTPTALNVADRVATSVLTGLRATAQTKGVRFEPADDYFKGSRVNVARLAVVGEQRATFEGIRVPLPGQLVASDEADRLLADDAEFRARHPGKIVARLSRSYLPGPRSVQLWVGTSAKALPPDAGWLSNRPERNQDLRTQVPESLGLAKLLLVVGFVAPLIALGGILAAVGARSRSERTEALRLLGLRERAGVIAAVAEDLMLSLVSIALGSALFELAASTVSERLPLGAGVWREDVSVARALVHSPQVIFADEPTGALDSANGTIVMESLTEQARQRGAAVVIVTHDPAAAAYADRVVQMRDGVLV